MHVLLEITGEFYSIDFGDCPGPGHLSLSWVTRSSGFQEGLIACLKHFFSWALCGTLK